VQVEDNFGVCTKHDVPDSDLPSNSLRLLARKPANVDFGRFVETMRFADVRRTNGELDFGAPQQFLAAGRCGG
jgi:hypothetical protein